MCASQAGRIARAAVMAVTWPVPWIRCMLPPPLVPADWLGRLERWSADKRVMQSSEGVDDVVVRVHAGVTGEAEDFAFYFGGDWCALGEADLTSVPCGNGALRPGELVADGALGA